MRGAAAGRGRALSVFPGATMRSGRTNLRAAHALRRVAESRRAETDIEPVPVFNPLEE